MFNFKNIRLTMNLIIKNCISMAEKMQSPLEGWILEKDFMI